MRFEAIHLRRYGHFSDRSLAFAAKDCDFHLILGPNEAGKSTLRQAIRDLLFGIPMNTPMSFLHPGADLELAAVLSGNPGELAFGRRRKRNGGLVDANGDPLPAERLGAWLGEVNEAFYERMFGLDHRRLEQGGKAMLQARDSVDSVLFQAAAGVVALNGVLEALRAESSALWAPRRSRERAWYAAADRLADAEAVLKAATVRPSAWVEADRESRRLDQAYVQAEAEHAGLLAQVRECERLRRSAPLLAQIRQYEAMVDSARSAGSGPDSAAHASWLVYQGDIVALGETRLRVADHQGSIERCDSRIQMLWARLGDVLRRLGRPVPPAQAQSLGSLAEALPPRPLRREIEQLQRQGRELDAECQAAALALAGRRAESERLRNEIESLPAVVVGDSLRVALDAATAVGDLDEQLQAARRRVEQEVETLRRRLRALTQPGVTPPEEVTAAAAWLADMEVYTSGRLVEQAQQRQRLQADIAALDERIREGGFHLQHAELELEQFRRSREAVSREEVLAARKDRDALWERMAAGGPLSPSDVEQFKRLIQHADNLADLHLQAVGDAARLEALQHEAERRKTALTALRGAQAKAREALATHEKAWANECVERSLPVLSPTDLQAWQAERVAVLTAHERVVAVEAEAEALARRHETVLQGLLEALAAEGQSINPGSLFSVCAHARSLLQTADKNLARRQVLTEQRAQIESRLPELEAAVRRYESERSAWGDRWHDALTRAGLPSGAQSAYVEEAITLLADADELAAQLRDSHAERDRLVMEREAYRREAERLAQQLNDPNFDPSSIDDHVRRWQAELEQARMAQRSRDEAAQKLRELTDRLLVEGEGRSRQQIEDELEGVDVSTLAERSDALGAELEQAAATRSRLAVERAAAHQALDAISGGDAAAQAEARRQEALADMAEIAERYIRLQAEQRLLERVMERYRERRQGPLLARAGALFSDLTLGAHKGLMVDSDEALLHARRADGQLVPLEGLSDGTRDQLYLALRLAALELYLDNAAPMPFIADDLFINYDDGRAIAGLKQLAALSGRTQVLFLTHHAHMVELAQEALGGPVTVIELAETD